MTWTLLTSIATPPGGYNGGPITVGPIDTTGADFIVVVGQTYGNINGSIISDNKTNSWTQTILDLDNFGSTLSVDWTSPSSVGSGHTFTHSSSLGTMQVMAWSGSNATPQDQFNQASHGSGTSAQTGSITPSESGTLIIAGLSLSATSTSDSFSINQGFTLQGFTDAVSGSNVGGAAAYLVQGSAAAVNPTWTWVPDGGNTTGIVSFKGSAVAAEELLGQIVL